MAVLAEETSSAVLVGVKSLALLEGSTCADSMIVVVLRVSASGICVGETSSAVLVDVKSLEVLGRSTCAGALVAMLVDDSASGTWGDPVEAGTVASAVSSVC